ncbi:MAG: hypothetical protein K6G50_05485 [bacterium]|nr:hypothetical protein [bacterium]
MNISEAGRIQNFSVNTLQARPAVSGAGNVQDAAASGVESHAADDAVILGSASSASVSGAELVSNENSPDSLAAKTSDSSDSSNSSAKAGKAAKNGVSADVAELTKRMLGDNPFNLEPIICSGTAGSDEIIVRNGENGALTVFVNNEAHTYTETEARRLIIDGGDGDDVIKVDRGVKQNLFITGGLGNDTIAGGAGNDTIIDNFGANLIDGGAGNDIIIAHGSAKDANGEIRGNTIQGGAGNDYIEGGDAADVIDGGAGNDVIYGLGGDDIITGGAGNDYIDGGAGNDKIDGGAGRDILVGGLGDDIINGGAGRDVIVGGKGHDIINGGLGRDVIVTSGAGDNSDTIASSSLDVIKKAAPMDVPANFSIDGDKYYQERVMSDLETLAAVEPGQAMMNGIAGTGKHVTITNAGKGNYCQHDTASYIDKDGNPGVKSDSLVGYNPEKIKIQGSEKWTERAPVIGLQHELAHSYNAATGTMDGRTFDNKGKETAFGTLGSEFQAMGLDNGTVKQNPQGISENALRGYFGQPLRDTY